jgi:hypothetical protein
MLPGLYGQADGERPVQDATRKPSIGIRVRVLPVQSFSVMDSGQSKATTTVSKTNYDWNYNTTSHSFPLGGGLAFDVPVTRRSILTVELLFTRLRYDKVTDTFWGTDDPTTSADERSHQTTTENTKARLFDVPVLLHRNLGASGLRSHFYLAAGPSVRMVSSVRTTTDITNADGTKANNSIPAPVAGRTLVGATVGAGCRFIDEFNIRVTPEIRYTRWNEMTFAQDSTRSPRNQLEVAIGFSR